MKYLASIEKQQNKECRIVCGYEAGCLGYSLYHQLHAHGIDCVILAPTTMMTTPGKRIKTDRRDARLISKCLQAGASSLDTPFVLSKGFVSSRNVTAIAENASLSDSSSSLVLLLKNNLGK